jgi:polyhydroxyalkanoate synthesis regulator phasin
VITATHERAGELVQLWIERGTLPEDEARRLVETLELLERVYSRHIGIEDREVFPAAARVLTPGQLERIGREMAERRGIAFGDPTS